MSKTKNVKKNKTITKAEKLVTLIAELASLRDAARRVEQLRTEILDLSTEIRDEVDCDY